MTEQIPGAPVGLKRPQPTSDWKVVNPKHVHFHNQMVFPHQDWQCFECVISVPVQDDNATEKVVTFFCNHPAEQVHKD